MGLICHVFRNHFLASTQKKGIYTSSVVMAQYTYPHETRCLERQRNAASKGLFQRLFPARTRLFPVLECQDEPPLSLFPLQPQGQKTNKANEVISLSALREAFSFPDRAGPQEHVRFSVCVFERVSHSRAKG